MTKRKNHSPAFKVRVALEAIHEEMMLAELLCKNGVHPNMFIGWKRAPIANMAQAFEGGKSDAARTSEAENKKLHSKKG